MFGCVERIEPLTPHQIRVVLGGEGLAEFDPGPWTDSYLSVYFPPGDAPYRVPFDLEAIRALPVEQRPATRRYTVRSWDAEQRRLTIDFVVHGDRGVAGPWVRAASPGDLLQFTGPKGGYAPDPAADWHLMMGDESALPAISASLSKVPPGAPVHVFVEVDSPSDELDLACPGEMQLTWLHRNDFPNTNDLQPRALQNFERPPGRVQAFVHGEAVTNRLLRKHLLTEWRVPREDLSISPYWHRTYSDERWREVRRDWLREVEQDA